MMDFVLEAWVSSLIEISKLRWMLGKGKPWQPGQKLKLLFAGYNGARNTGSDLRVEEMLRQIRQILGQENVAFSVMTQNFKFTPGYFEGTAQVRLPDIFPPFLFDEVPKHHGVVACEGSMFKSKFANALTTMMIGSLGIAAAENKLSVGYGAEAGYMDSPIAKMCARYCQNSLIITRNEESRTVLRERILPSTGKRHCDKWVGTAAHPCWSYARLILSSGRSRPQLLNSRYTVSQAHTRTATTDRCTSTTLGRRRTALTSTT